eukprot:TRINITY_DN4068_c0_g1_i1.p1 TRINITY_DN4068_c0_g1~~TRINITY_DN4068_c0_g1_i1.p1  ORF type:complete len:549 (+),score=141.59 TRINITY_DN4068_c0_g1_i1:39-1649(+)
MEVDPTAKRRRSRPQSVEYETQPWKRGKLVRDMLFVEQSYVSSLAGISEKWEKPLRAIASEDTLFCESDIKHIFSIISDLVEFHQSFLRDLDRRIGNWHDQQEIGDVFIQNMKNLVLYFEYMKIHQKAKYPLQYLLQNNPQLKKPSRPDQLDPPVNTKEVDLLTILSAPLQKISGYKKFLTDLLGMTPDSHFDYHGLAMAVEQISHVEDHLNLFKGKGVMLERLGEIQNIIGKEHRIWDLNRIIVTEGQLMIRKAKVMDEEKKQFILSLKSEAESEPPKLASKGSILRKSKNLFTSKKSSENNKFTPQPEKPLDKSTLPISYVITNDIILIYHQPPSLSTKILLFAPLNSPFYFESEMHLRISNQKLRLFISSDNPSLQVLTNAILNARNQPVEASPLINDQTQTLQILNQLEIEYRKQANLGIHFKVITHEIKSSGIRSQVILYHIQVTKRGEQQYIVKIRFSDISILHESYGKKCGLAPPKKHQVEALVSGSEEKFIEKRKKELQDYLDSLLKCLDSDQIKEPNFVLFFQIPSI